MRAFLFALLAVPAISACSGADAPTQPADPCQQGIPSALTARGGDPAPAYAHDTVRLSVQVACGQAHPLAGRWVRWTVLSGGGAFLADSSQSGADGVAQAVLRLGGVGTVEAQASLAGLAPVHFTASAVDPCTPLRTLALTDSVRGVLSNAGCTMADNYFAWPGMRHQFFGLQLAATAAIRFSLEPSGFFPRLSLGRGPGQQLLMEMNTTSEPNVVRMVLPAGDYQVIPADPSANAFQAPTPFVLRTRAVALQPTCEAVGLARPVSFTATLGSRDCGTTLTRDQYLVRLGGGDSVTVVMRSSAFAPDLGLARAVGYNGWSILKGASTTAPGEQTLRYTAATTDWYVILANWNGDPARTGDYTLDVR